MHLTAVTEAINRYNKVTSPQTWKAIENKLGAKIKRFVIAPYSVTETERNEYFNRYLSSKEPMTDFVLGSGYTDVEVYYIVDTDSKTRLIPLSQINP